MGLRLRGLRQRMILAFSLFSILLGLFYWFLTAGLLMLSEDSILNQQLVLELKRQQQHYNEHQHFDQLPSGMQIHSPMQVKAHPYYIHFAEMRPGLYELEELDTHIGRVQLADGNEFYITYDVSNQDIDPATFNTMMVICLISVGIVSVLGILIGSIVGMRTVEPIVKLDQRVQALGRNDSFGDTDGFGEDEVNRLAHSFAEAFERSRQFLEREERFTREVSHELRTPTAVIQNATELLALQPDNPKALQRIRRASQEIHQLIETFLTLGREENLSLSDEVLDIQTLCLSIIEGMQDQSEVKILLQFHQDPELKVLPPVFAIVLKNLLSNAIRHTEEGCISVQIDANEISVVDTGCGFKAETLAQLGEAYVAGSSSSGLGLSIVQRICQQFSWQLQVESRPDQGSSVTIRFN